MFALNLDGREVVLKITDDPRRRAGAVLELELLADPRSPLREFLPDHLAGSVTSGAVYLLLEAHHPYPPGVELSEPDWLLLAHCLGRLHRSPFPRYPPLPLRAWLSDLQVSRALDRWSDHGLAGLARRGARLLAALHDQPALLAAAVTHGDCHTENLARAPDGRPRWLDWQDACSSDGLDDLVFLWERAEFAGAGPPRAAMVDRLRRLVELGTDDGSGEGGTGQ